MARTWWKIGATLLAATLAASPAAAVISYEFAGQSFGGLQGFVLKSSDFIASPTEVQAAQLDSCAAAFTTCERVLLFNSGNSVAIQFFEADLIPFAYFFPGAQLDRLGFYQSSAPSNLGLLSITGTVDPPPPPPPPEPGVPEPATWAMLLTGFGLAGTALRRRRGAALNRGAP